MHVKNPLGGKLCPEGLCTPFHLWNEIFLDQGLFCRQTLVQWSPEIWIKEAPWEEKIYIVWETHLEFWWICSLKRIIFSHLNGFLFPSLNIWRMGLWDHSLRMGVHTMGQLVEVCLGKCKVTQSSFFGSTIRMSAYLKNLLLLELEALLFSCSTSLHTLEKCALRTN